MKEEKNQKTKSNSSSKVNRKSKQDVLEEKKVNNVSSTKTKADKKEVKSNRKVNKDKSKEDNKKLIKVSKTKKDEDGSAKNKKGESTAVKLYKKKKLKKQKKKFNGRFNLDVLDLLLVVAGTAIISCVLTGIILNFQYKKNLHLIDSSVVSDKNVQEFLNTYSEIVDNYYEEVNAEDMMKAAMEGMLNFLEDNYSIYLNKNDSDNLSEMLDGTYEGVGIVIRGNIIEDIYKNSPAEKSGLKTGDIIIGINDNKVSMDNYEEIGSFIKMDKENSIIIKRDSEEMTFNVMPSTVSIPATTSNIIKSPDKKKNIGYISLNAFSSKSFEDFQESLMDLESKEMDSLIIDLRNNTGGYLNAATNIANLFLEKGEVIYSLENKNKITAFKDETNDKREYKIVILVNSSTASAAEILTAALHDSYGAIVVGKTTYGKGKVQTMKYYENSIVKYTSAKWLRPNGECIDEVGIIPDYDINIKVSNGETFDTQLDKAIELLSK